MSRRSPSPPGRPGAARRAEHEASRRRLRALERQLDEHACARTTMEGELDAVAAALQADERALQQTARELSAEEGALAAVHSRLDAAAAKLTRAREGHRDALRREEALHRDAVQAASARESRGREGEQLRARLERYEALRRADEAECSRLGAAIDAAAREAALVDHLRHGLELITDHVTTTTPQPDGARTTGARSRRRGGGFAAGEPCFDYDSPHNPTYHPRHVLVDLSAPLWDRLGDRLGATRDDAGRPCRLSETFRDVGAFAFSEGACGAHARRPERSPQRSASASLPERSPPPRSPSRRATPPQTPSLGTARTLLSPPSRAAPPGSCMRAA